MTPGVGRAFGLAGRAAVAEISLDACLAARGERGGGYRPIHRYPVVPFDVAVVVPRRTPSSEVAAAIEGVDGDRVRDVQVFDVYEGPGIPEGHRSLAFRLDLLDPEGTLTPRKADRLRRRIVASIEQRGWTVRSGS